MSIISTTTDPTTMTTSMTTIVVTAATTVGVVLVVQLVWNYYYRYNNNNKHKNKTNNYQKQMNSSSSSSSSLLQQQQSQTIQEVPWAPGAIPVLGHALLYKKDPAGFLVRMCHPPSNSNGNNNGNNNTNSTTTSNVFRLNLAGKHMTLVCGPYEQRQIATLPESIMSARQAVADIGFEYTLGHTNVHVGTDLHKGIVKGIFHNNSNNSNSDSNSNNSIDNNTAVDVRDHQVKMWLRSIRDSFKIETTTTTTKTKPVVDFFVTIRRVTLRTTVDVMIGRSFLDGWRETDDDDEFDFITQFMNFQDELEDVTAKSVVLPRPVALVTMLWPLQRRRHNLQRIIANRLTVINNNKTTNNASSSNSSSNNDNENNDKGFWLRSIEEDGHDVETISELIIGLLFAAHKNPAIGAAQTYLLLQEHATEPQLNQCRLDASSLLTNPTWNQLLRSSSSSSSSSLSNGNRTTTANNNNTNLLRRACMESLRLTSHSIGGVRTAQQDVTITSKVPNNDNNDGNDDGNDDVDVVRYKIPKGTSVGLVHIASSLDTSIWGPDATKFDLSEPSSSSSSSSSSSRDRLYQDEYKFTTFSHGVHVCPGQQLAIMMLQLINAVLLNDYVVDLSDDDDVILPPLCFERATLAQRTKPIMVSITPKQQQQQ